MIRVRGPVLDVAGESVACRSPLGNLRPGILIFTKVRGAEVSFGDLLCVAPLPAILSLLVYNRRGR